MRTFCAVLCVLVASGCASLESIDQFYDQVVWEDGINRNEAAVIAKKWLSQSKYEGDFQLLGPVSTRHENEWQITFLYKSLSYYEKVLDVFVDPKTGEIRGSAIRHRTTPNVFKEGGVSSQGF